jgi:sulfate adenylyltransferase large subunit
MELVRLTTAGSVDDGKSTLVGRLLFDSKSIFEDQVQAVDRASRALGGHGLNLALFTDGLRAEREQGITIDVAYRYFATPRRKFIIADVPGHLQFTRNMVTGASTANVAVVLVDARHGIVQQTRRHCFVASLLRIPHLVLCVNKMDLVGWSQTAFEAVRAQFEEFSERLDLPDVTFIPVSALQGDNVVSASAKTPWYAGRSVLQQLEEVHIASDLNRVDLRVPVQLVLRPGIAAGTLASGSLRVGETLTCLPSKRSCTVRSLRIGERDLPSAEVPLSVTIALDGDPELARGSVLARPDNLPQQGHEIDATVCWMQDAPLEPGRRYLLQHTAHQTGCVVQRVHYGIDIDTLHRTQAPSLGRNDIGRVLLRTDEPLLFDAYRRNRVTGSFIVIDETSLTTAGAGMIR